MIFIKVYKQRSIFSCSYHVKSKELSVDQIDRIIGMAWEDRTPFDAIENQFGLTEKQVIQLMRNSLKPSSFRKWRERVQGRNTKHLAKRNNKEGRFRSSRQKQITLNKISKRN